MTGLYARWMDQWERKLATRDTNRVVRPFEWGTDWLNSLGFPALSRRRQRQLRANAVPLRHAKRWPIPTASSPTSRCATTGCNGNHLTFTSPVQTPLSGEQHGARAVVPGAQGQRPRADRPAAVEFRPGRARGPGEAAESVRHQRLADDHGVSRRAQAGRDRSAPTTMCRATSAARSMPCRQSAIDVRACVDWLRSQGI